MRMIKTITGYIGHRTLIVLVMAGFVVASVAAPVAVTPAYAQGRSLDNDPSNFGEHYDGLMFALRENWVAAFMMMTEQFVTVMMHQMLILGTFLDAEQQVEVQNLYRSLAAQAHKEYHPSMQMCFFGTGVKSLAAADMNARNNAMIIDRLFEARDYGNYGSSASGGNITDYTGRLNMFKQTYCDIRENNSIEEFCGGSSGPRLRRMRDVDYVRLVDLPYTISTVNFADATAIAAERDLIALGRNLFGSRTFDFIPEQVFYEEGDDEREMTGMGLFMETRSVHAMRSVARRSYANIVGMKTAGEFGNRYESAPFIKAIVHELGVPEDEINDFLGANPSYFAQMEVLTRKMYQSPEFYTNLYDKPDNVTRTGVAIQALKLMQDRDRFESSLRREMLVSLMVELKLRDHQKQVNRTLVSAVANTTGEPDY